MKKLILVLSFFSIIYADVELGRELINGYSEVVYICKDDSVMAMVNTDNGIIKIPVVWE